MSDEEKKAIEYLKRHIIPYYEKKGTIEFMLNDTILNLIEKQSKEIEEYKKQLDLNYVDKHFVPIERYNQLEKEIEELKDDRKKYAEEYIHNNPWLYKQLNENYILRVESEQKERKAWIKGTNDAHELCNKKWKDKIKAKTEPVLKQLERKMEEEYNKYGNSREYQDVVDAYNFLQSLLEKE